MRVLITGARGFIGAHLLRSLADSKHEVWGLDRINPLVPPGVASQKGDLFDLDWDVIMEWGPDVVVHLAGPASVAKSFADLHAETRNSVLLTSFLLEKLRRRRGSRFVYFSSAAVYGEVNRDRCVESATCQPYSPYGVGKFAAEQLIRAAADIYGLDFAILRPFSVYGPGLTKQVVYDVARRFLLGENPVVIQSSGRELRDFVYVEDCCSVVRSLLERPSFDALVVNVGTGQPVSLAQLIEMIVAEAAPGARYEFTGRDRPGNPGRLVADVETLHRLGWACGTDLRSGLRHTIPSIANSLPAIAETLPRKP